MPSTGRIFLILSFFGGACSVFAGMPVSAPESGAPDLPALTAASDMIVAGRLAPLPKRGSDLQWRLIVHRVFWGGSLVKGTKVAFSVPKKAALSSEDFPEVGTYFLVRGRDGGLQLPSLDWVRPIHPAEVRRGNLSIHLDPIVGSTDYQAVFQAVQAGALVMRPAKQSVAPGDSAELELMWRNLSYYPARAPAGLRVEKGRLVSLNGAVLSLFEEAHPESPLKPRKPVVKDSYILPKIEGQKAWKARLDLSALFPLLPGKSYLVEWRVKDHVSNRVRVDMQAIK